MGNRGVAAALTVILVLGLVLGLAGSASAGRLDDDETINLTYKDGFIKCIMRWSYDDNDIAIYEMSVFRHNGIWWQWVESSPLVRLRKPSAKGHATYEFAAVPGRYFVQVYLRSQSHEIIDLDNVDHYITIP